MVRFWRFLEVEPREFADGLQMGFETEEIRIIPQLYGVSTQKDEINCGKANCGWI